MKNKVGKIFFFASLILLVFIAQFIIGYKHLQYGFNIDDWNILAWYKQVVSNPILDMVGAWKEIGPHNFSHAYYIGILFEFFKFNYPYYHILNTVFKAISALSLFPVVYLLFKNKWFATLATSVFAIHFTPFGGLNNVLIGEDSLMIASMNLFLAVYIWAFQKNKFTPKIMAILLTLLLAASYFDITRFYPVLMLLPLIELGNYWLNKSQRNIKALLIRLLILYAPFIALILYSPNSIREFCLCKLIDMIRTENYELLVSLFASFGSTFAPIAFIDQFRLLSSVGNNPVFGDFWTFFEFIIFRFTLFFLPVLVVMGSLTLSKSGKFIFRSLLFSFLLSFFAYLASNHWIFLDPKIRISDPGTYFVPATLGIVVFSTAISYFIESIQHKDKFLLTLSLAPIVAFLYTFLTWILVDASSTFMGVHGYLSIASVGSSIYLSIFLYLALKKLISKLSFFKKIIPALTVVYFFLFLIFTYQMVDNFYAYWIKNGFGGVDQDRMHNSFWREVGREKFNGQNKTLIYFDGSVDYDNGYFYSQSFVWVIPAMLKVEKGEPYVSNGYCQSAVANKDFDKMKVQNMNGEKVIIQNTCGYDLTYKVNNFYAFKMINRDLTPIKSEILSKLESK